MHGDSPTVRGRGYERGRALSLQFACRWDTVCCLLVLYVALALPPQVAFADSSEIGLLRVLDLIIDGLFFIDVYINFRTGGHRLPCHMHPSNCIQRRIERM
jgi:hypothetical protein